MPDAAVAIAPNVDDVTVMQEPVDEGAGHDVIAEDLAPGFKAFVARQHRGRVFVAPTHQLIKQLRAGARDREIADFVDDHQTRRDERAQSSRVLPRLLRLFQPENQIGQRRVIHAAPPLGRGNGETNREVRFPDARRAEEDDIFAPLDEAPRYADSRVARGGRTAGN